MWDDSGDDLLAERAWLVHLCRRFTGDPDAAEDLAQETLVDAWQHLQGQAAPPTRRAWLAGIARHRCLRWARRHRRDVARLIHVDAEPDAPLTLEISDASDGGALDLELGCDDLAALLDRALRLVPAQTRQVLVQRYIASLCWPGPRLAGNAHLVPPLWPAPPPGLPGRDGDRLRDALPWLLPRARRVLDR